ncbi:hypothetical protein FA15DRAFT_674308 [Coprinopsis marcescibilis]|uniref:RlpA-like protein double-psi beta-barrel domain-containing protein n=1 Tax=Coprinopsis marcescibilis TaxID=230819 RepID=A0A5C3KHS5_COPMA|nr:hypothetical protein FA15DRAFT_674308 [Coprinopsis marcescibilis]
MARITSSFATLACALFLALGASANPIAGPELEKRVDHEGRGTWFNVGLGNCGKVSKDSEPVVAMSKAFYDENHGSNCGQWVEITDRDTGKTALGQLWDSCPGCGRDDLDLSPSLFQQFAPLSKGVINISWHFKAKDFHP